MENVAVKALFGLTSRIIYLEQTRDPELAGALLKWVRDGGLESLKPDLEAYFENRQAIAPFVYRFDAHLFTQWRKNEHIVQSASFSTVRELRELLSKEFGIPLDQFGITIEGIHGLRDDQQLGEFLSDYNSNDPEVILNLTLYPIGEAKWFEDAKGEFTVPVLFTHIDNTDDEILVPITRADTFNDFAFKFKGLVYASYKGPYTSKREWYEFDKNVFTEWAKSNFVPFMIDELDKHGRTWSQLQYLRLTGVSTD